jgi:ABC-type multidrug transport system fused ATPase/permease subunit
MLTRKNLLSVGGIMAFVQLLNYVTAPMGKIFGLVQQIIAAKPVLTKVSDILEYECVTGKQIEKHDLTDAIEINNLTFTYESNHEPTLSNINLRFEKGKSYALVGLSGSGKSTLMHILAGYYDQFEGSVLIDGVDFRSISEKSACQLISFVQQDCFVFDDTILNNVCLYKKWDDSDVQLALNRAGLRTLIDARGIDAPCGENGALLSGGEKQRISIARALLCGSPIILLDEATSALDAQTTEEVEKAIAAIENTTRIVITHKMNAEILKRYDSIILMRDGIVTNQGTYDQLVEQNGWFRSMCETN